LAAALVGTGQYEQAMQHYQAALALKPDQASTYNNIGLLLAKRAQFDLASARRAQGLGIDWVDDERGRGLVIDNPNAPPKVQPLTAVEARERVAAGTLVLVDVRPADERLVASINEPFSILDGEAMAHLEALEKDTALASCATTAAQRAVAEHFRGLGFRSVANIGAASRPGPTGRPARGALLSW
jgi:monothiol glutaredoxin